MIRQGGGGGGEKMGGGRKRGMNYCVGSPDHEYRMNE
jgi:hypothetical protein